MTKFIETDEGRAFISSGDSRETSPEIMRAIAFFARDLAEAEALWEGDWLGKIAHLRDIWERVTDNGLRDAADYVWGAEGHTWWPDEKYIVTNIMDEGGAEWYGDFRALLGEFSTRDAAISAAQKYAEQNARAVDYTYEGEDGDLLEPYSIVVLVHTGRTDEGEGVAARRCDKLTVPLS